MEWDPRSQCIVAFGGEMAGGFLSETWTWNGSDWTQAQCPTSPSARIDASLAFDSARQDLVLFGGNNGLPLSDTWSFDGSTWIRLLPQHSPPARSGGAFCFETHAGRAILFGGNTSGPSLSDTWQWDGIDWIEIPTGWQPIPRSIVNAAMDYLPTTQTCLLFGGWNGSVLGDTWTFGSSRWRPAIHFQSSPVNGNLYGQLPPLRWDEAEALAQFLGGHLATIRTQTEQDWLGQTFMDPNLYIGLSDAAQEGTWVWASGEPTTFTSWCAGEPNDLGGNQDYANINGCFGADDWDDGNGPTGSIVELITTVSASTQVYGSPCIGSAGPLSIQAIGSSLPIIGRTLQLQVTGVPFFSPCIGYVGFSKTFLGGTPLPIPLDTLNMPGCSAHQSADLSFFLGQPNNTTQTTAWPLAIPNDPIFLALHIYLQGLALEFTGRFATTTDAIDARIGNR